MIDLLKFGRVLWRGILIGLCLALFPFDARAQSVVWVTNKAEAISAAQAQGKMILLLAGRDNCAYCQRMKGTICELESPPIETILSQSYVAWYCRLDESSDWRLYTNGLGNFTLPLICVIDPNRPTTHLDRSTGVQEQKAFYERLQGFITNQLVTPPKLSIVRPSNGLAELTWVEDPKWKLQRASSALDWQDVKQTIEIKDGKASCWVSVDVGTQFFRLVPVTE
jgi:hypothetical protein